MATSISSLQKAKALVPGMTIAIVSPAAPSSQESLQQGQELLEARGYKVKRMPNSGNSHRGYLAGSDEERAADLMAAFQDPDVDAILCSRGGYGCARVLPHLDLDTLAKHPKLFMGFSDVTVLHNAFFDHFGLVSFYSPMLTSNLIEANQDFTWAQLFRAVSPEGQQVPWSFENQDTYHCFQEGIVEAPLRGGNLSLLASLCGTPWQPKLGGSILIIEDWKESYYTLDRQLLQIKQSGLFEGIKGLLFGDFSFCEPEFDYSLAEQLKALSDELGVPCGYGFTFGHGQQTITLPLGAQARFDAKAGALTLLEAATL